MQLLFLPPTPNTSCSKTVVYFQERTGLSVVGIMAGFQNRLQSFLTLSSPAKGPAPCSGTQPTWKLPVQHLPETQLLCKHWSFCRGGTERARLLRSQNRVCRQAPPRPVIRQVLVRKGRGRGERTGLRHQKNRCMKCLPAGFWVQTVSRPSHGLPSHPRPRWLSVTSERTLRG